MSETAPGIPPVPEDLKPIAKQVRDAAQKEVLKKRRKEERRVIWERRVRYATMLLCALSFGGVVTLNLNSNNYVANRQDESIDATKSNGRLLEEILKGNEISTEVLKKFEVATGEDARDAATARTLVLMDELAKRLDCTTRKAVQQGLNDVGAQQGLEPINIMGDCPLEG